MRGVSLNRFFRSALFPLIVIAALVWLAVQTLSGHGKKSEKASYGDVVQLIEGSPASIKQAVFSPGKHELTITKSDGKTKITVHYPSDQGTPFLNAQLLAAQKQNPSLEIDSKGTGSSAWSSILTGLLPFVLLLAFWIFPMQQLQDGVTN